MSNENTGDYSRLQSEGQYQIGLDIPDIQFKEIGKRGIRRIDGYEKASGAATYTRDIQLPGMVYAKVLASPYPRARIKHMDTEKASSIPGVRCVIRYDDSVVSGKMLNGSYFGPEWVCADVAGWALKPVHPVLGDEAWYEGQPLGVAIAADNESIAEEALRAVNIQWDILPFVLDQEEALKTDAPILRPNASSNLLEDPREDTEMGDVEKDFGGGPDY